MEHSTLEVAPSIWDCDKCHQPIWCAKHGVLEWTTDRESSRRRGLKIVHHSEYSPVKNAFRIVVPPSTMRRNMPGPEPPMIGCLSSVTPPLTSAKDVGAGVIFHEAFV